MWKCHSLGLYTDLVLVCEDGKVETRKAMLANVIKYLGPGLLEEDLECLVVPGVTTGQVEVALERVYIHFDIKPIWKLLKDQRQDPEPELGVCNVVRHSQLAPLPLQAEQDQHPIATDHREVEDQAWPRGHLARGVATR